MRVILCPDVNAISGRAGTDKLGASLRYRGILAGPECQPGHAQPLFTLSKHEFRIQGWLMTASSKSFLKKLLRRKPEAVELQAQTTKVKRAFEDGHFYSPVCDPVELAKERERIWPDSPTTPGIDYNEQFQRHVLTELFPKFFPDYQYPEHQPSKARTTFYTQNSQFSWLDARAWFVLLRAWKPSQIIEVGSGFSSLLTADVNHRFFANQAQFRCIEPYPRDFLRAGVPGLTGLTVARVQEVPLTEFEELQSGDILFVDSSHVAKTGSDVNFLSQKLNEELKGLELLIDMFVHSLVKLASGIDWPALATLSPITSSILLH